MLRKILQKIILIPILLVLLVVSGLSMNANATNRDRIPGTKFPSVRGMALGDSLIGLGETTQEGLFYNPALLGKNRDFDFEIFNIQNQMNPDLMGQFGKSWYKFPSLSQYVSTLKTRVNEFPEGSLSVFPSFQIGGFGVGLLYQARIASQFDGTNVHYKSLYQLIPTAGYGLRLASGVLKIGYVFQYVNQASGDLTVAETTSPLGYSESLAEGAGFSHLFGGQLTLPYVYQPSLEVVVRNIGGLHFSKAPLTSLTKNATGSLTDEEMSIDFGVSYLWKWGSGLDFVHAITFRDFTDSSKTARLAHLGTGMEWQFNKKFFLRAGFASAYPSLGLGIKMGHGRIDFSWSSEENGSGLRSSRNRRVSFQIAVNAF